MAKSGLEHRTASAPAGGVSKRVLDLFVIVSLAPFWVPVALVVALCVRLKMGSPVLFCQERTGKDGKPFMLRKFRTMREGAGTDAERLTRFGRFLRASSLDELPELLNVLKGEMSLVGPRPLPVRYLPRYSPEQNRRHEVLPGITGWAQVNGRNALDWETKFDYDLEYVECRSISFDFMILMTTAWQVICPKHISHEGEATMSEFMGNPVPPASQNTVPPAPQNTVPPASQNTVPPAPSLAASVQVPCPGTTP